MNYPGAWHWNPIRGEYEIPDSQPLHGSGEISAVDAFSNKTVLLMGATGFVGKVLLAMLLDRFPELNRLVVQVRKKRNATGEQRFYNEVLQSPPLRYVAERHGAENIREKIMVIEGDVNEDLCGVQTDLLDKLRGTV